MSDLSVGDRVRVRGDTHSHTHMAGRQGTVTWFGANETPGGLAYARPLVTVHMDGAKRGTALIFYPTELRRLDVVSALAALGDSP